AERHAGLPRPRGERLPATNTARSRISLALIRATIPCVSWSVARMSGATCGVFRIGSLPGQRNPAYDRGMVKYRRNFLPGGTFFFTVTLADRRSRLLVDSIGRLRNAFRAARLERPFTIEAIVILPEHLHAILTLPSGDADFAGRWRRIKGHFASALLDVSVELPRRPNGELALWHRRF